MSSAIDPASNPNPAIVERSNRAPRLGFVAKCLNSLPNELLVGILSRLDCPDLARVSRVSRHFNIVAEPYLYRSLSLTSYGEPGPSPFHIIILTLLSRPLLANHVRFLNLCWHAIPSVRSADDPKPQTLAGMDILTSLATSLGLTHPPYSDGAQIVLLLHLLPHLEVLHLAPPSSPDLFTAFFDERAIHPATPLPAALQSVREIRYDLSDRNFIWQIPEGGLSPTLFLALFGLPSIRILDICFVCPAYLQINWTSVANLADHIGASPVTDLRFGSGDVKMSQFEMLLSLPAGLTHLTYGAESYSGRCLFHPLLFSRALQSSKQTLQSLVICFRQGLEEHCGCLATKNPVPLGSFTDWLALRSMRCSLTTLLGVTQVATTPRLVDVVPVGIRELEIELDEVWSEEKVVDELVLVLERKGDGGLRDLETLIVPPCCGAMRRLTEACDAARVALVTSCRG